MLGLTLAHFSYVYGLVWILKKRAKNHDMIMINDYDSGSSLRQRMAVRNY